MCMYVCVCLYVHVCVCVYTCWRIHYICASMGRQEENLKYCPSGTSHHLLLSETGSLAVLELMKRATWSESARSLPLYLPHAGSTLCSTKLDLVYVSLGNLNVYNGTALQTEQSPSLLGAFLKV